MSVDTPASETTDRRPRFACAVCGDSVEDASGRIMASYPSAKGVGLSAAEADGLLPLCGDCTGEVTDLTAAWTELRRPPVATADSIADSYAAVAENCGFCDGAIEDGPVLGIESWSTGADETADGCADHDNYALCERCVAIFEEFLQGIASE